MFLYVFPIFFSLSVDTSLYTQSTVSHFLSLARDPGIILGKEKTGDGAIGVDLVGGGYCIAADPLSVQTYFLLEVYTGNTVYQLKCSNLTERKKEKVEKKVGLSLSKPLDPV